MNAAKKHETQNKYFMSTDLIAHERTIIKQQTHTERNTNMLMQSKNKQTFATQKQTNSCIIKRE